MNIIINEPFTAANFLAERALSDGSSRDEVWEGVYIVSPIANNDHQLILARLLTALGSVLDFAAGAEVFQGVNVSDREDGWLQNYRIPDLAVVLPGSRARDCETHLCGGPDFLVEVLSRNDLAREKREFYAEIGVREFLIIDRDPWALELYRLDGAELNPVGRSTVEHPDLIVSEVLPLVLRMLPGEQRPRIEVRTTDGKQAWNL